MDIEKWIGLAPYLSCPDDGALLNWVCGEFTCKGCGRTYRPRDGILDLLPKTSSQLLTGAVSQEYTDYYQTELARTTCSAHPFAWGAAEELSETRLRIKKWQASEVLRNITQGVAPAEIVFCDVTGAAGHYTFPASSSFRYVFHCDLSLDGLAYASEKALQLGLKNIFFLRIDYLQLPFRDSIDRLICMDTLIRGRTHEIQLLRNIHASLSPGGRALVDFHNWWHNPIRRLGLLRDNFAGNVSYSRSGADAILKASGINRFHYLPFHQEWKPGATMGPLMAKVVPPTRLMYLFSKDNA